MMLYLWTVAAVAIIAAAVVFSPALAISALPPYLSIVSDFSVKSGNLLYNARRLGSHRLVCAMEVKGYMLLNLTNTLLTAVTLGLFHPWVKVCTLRYKVQHIGLLPTSATLTVSSPPSRPMGVPWAMPPGISSILTSGYDRYPRPLLRWPNLRPGAGRMPAE